MIILHGSVYDGQFLLWGESPRHAEVRPGAPTGQMRRRRAATACAHAPSFAYDAGIEPLVAALADVGVDLADDADQAAMASGWLPTQDDTPLASSPLIAEIPVSRVPPMLRPWSVSTLCLSPGETIDLLCACVGHQTLTPGIVVGTDLAYWATAMGLAGAMVARQQFLPALEVSRLPGQSRRSARAEERRYRTRWRAVFGGLDMSRLTRLAKAMPDVCRALCTVGPDAKDTPQRQRRRQTSPSSLSSSTASSTNSSGRRVLQ